MNNKKLTKCNFCKYSTTSGCMVRPSSYYCKEANDEYYQYLRSNKGQTIKSLKPWDRNK